MALLRAAVLFVIILALPAAGEPRPTLKKWKEDKAKQEAKKASAKADQKKNAAVDKVVVMLEALTQKVLDEGEAEAESYNRFACFCKTVQGDKVKAIKEEKDTSQSLTASINKLSSGRRSDDKSIANNEKIIRATDDDSAKSMKDNANSINKYSANKADLTKAIDSLHNAMKTLKASKPSLLQLESASNTVQEAMAMADALGLGVDTIQGPSAVLLQGAPSVDMENYKFHAGGVIGTIEKLLVTFRDKKNKADADEIKRLAAHDMKMQRNTDKVTAKTLEVEDSTKEKEEKTADIAASSEDLTTETAALRTDQEYLANLYKMCEMKAKTWAKRSQVRADELSALTAATSIVKGAVRESTSKSTIRFAQRGVSIRVAEAAALDRDAMDAVEAEAEENESRHGLNLLQRGSMSRQVAKDPVDRISELLHRVARKTKSTMLVTLALEISAAAPRGLEKVKTLVEELIERLQAEAANEGEQKGWCDKSRSAATTKRNTIQQNVDEANDQLAALEADSKGLTEALNNIADEIGELRAAQIEEDKMRYKDMMENEETIAEAKTGLKAINQAIDILEKFYNGAAKGKDEDFKAAEKVRQTAPDAGFDGGEAYTGSQSSATGVIGMLDVIKSDFVRTVKFTEQAEEQSNQDYRAFTDQTQTTFVEQRSIQKARNREKSDAEARIRKLRKHLKKETDLLVGVVDELLELKKSCVDTGMSYADRKARREEDIAALNKALCILDPGSSDNCLAA